MAPRDLAPVQAAVAEAEKKTSGEIACVLVEESSDYGFYELFFSCAGALLYLALLILGHAGVEAWFDRLFWDPSPRRLELFYGLSPFGVMFLLYWLANIPGADRLIVPRRFREKAVHRRALVSFVESGVYQTRDHSGVLLFVSLRERRAEIIADREISRRVEPQTWDRILEDLGAKLRARQLVPGLVQAVAACGETLAGAFPRRPDDENELPDAPVYLKD
ncbi:MAG: TPM domain-containing protein [Spirochaetales bacterium]|jgi:putative membrane protein|nr:TPM domain-containing protein [Spirochaetales bacterium]